MLKPQIASSEAEIEDTLWGEYEELELNPDQRQLLTAESAGH